MVTVTVAVAWLVPLRVVVEGVIAQLASAGAPMQLHATFPANPFTGETLIVYVAVCPALTVADCCGEVGRKSAKLMVIGTDALWPE